MSVVYYDLRTNTRSIFNTGVWVIKFPRVVLRVSVQGGARLFAGEKIQKGTRSGLS